MSRANDGGGGREGRKRARGGRGGRGWNEGASTRVSLERFVIAKAMKNTQILTHTVQRIETTSCTCRGAYSAIEPERN